MGSSANSTDAVGSNVNLAASTSPFHKALEDLKAFKKPFKVVYDDAGQPIKIIVPSATNEEGEDAGRCNEITLPSQCHRIGLASPMTIVSADDSLAETLYDANNDDGDGGRSVAESIAAESVAETIQTTLSEVSAGKLPVVRESQPLGGPKYYGKSKHPWLT